MYPRDLVRIDQLYQKQFANDFGLPSDRNTLGTRVVELDGKLLAFGMIKLQPEAIIMIDSRFSEREKVLALQMLYSEAIKVCLRSDFENLDAFIIDPAYKELLKKHFKFKEVEGTRMSLEI